MTYPTCHKCGSTSVGILRDLKGTRVCGSCHARWLPDEDGGVKDELQTLRAQLAAKDAEIERLRGLVEEFIRLSLHLSSAGRGGQDCFNKAWIDFAEFIGRAAAEIAQEAGEGTE